MSFLAPVGKKSPQNPASSVSGPPNYSDPPAVGIETDYARSDHSHGLPAATGGSGTPSATVTGPDAFGAASVVGVQANYSRGDHDHGLPSLPFIPAASSTVSGPPSYGSSPVVGVATSYSRGDHSHGLPTGSGSPATTVTGPDSYGAASVVGVSSLYARADHDHGLPGASGGTPASSVTGPDAYGASSAVGTNPNYARQDHDHGLPSAPFVPSAATSVIGPGVYGSSPVVGVGTTYARNDHFHGLPAASGSGYADPAVFYVANFGATGNGSTDDTTSIQNCLDTGGAHSIIIFDRLNYKISAKLKFYTGQTLIGKAGLFDPSHGTQLSWSGATTGAMMSSLNTGQVCYNPTVKNIRFTGNGNNDICLDFTLCTLGAIEGVYLENNKAGAVGILFSNGFTYFNIVQRCQTSITGSATAVGLKFTNGANANTVIGHKGSADNITVWCDINSEVNVFVELESEGNTTGVVYIDAPFNKFYGCHFEATGYGFNFNSSLGKGTVISGYTYSTITNPIQGQANLSGQNDLAVMPIAFQQGPMQIIEGTGSPAGTVSANVGSMFLRQDGGASTTLYIKESGTGTSGWVAK